MFFVSLLTGDGGREGGLLLTTHVIFERPEQCSFFKRDDRWPIAPYYCAKGG